MTPKQYICKKSYLRDIIVLGMHFSIGARASEICSLTSGSVDLTNHTIRIFDKGFKARIIQIENSEVLQKEILSIKHPRNKIIMK